jgi:uncharacterized repeat protein (TIGR01451 family)
MTKREERIEHILRDLAAEPVQVSDEFKRRLITTLQQEQRDILQAGADRRLRDSFSHWARSWWSRPAVRWAFVAAALVVALVGILIPWMPQRPLLTVRQGVAQVSSQQPSAPGSQQSQGDVISIAEGARITLDEDSAASLLLFNDNKVELLAGTQLTLTKVQPRSIWQAQTVRMQMSAGEVQVQVSPLRSPNERFEVDLPAAIVSVRGTVFRARVVSPQHTYVATDEGVVAVMLHDPSQGNPLVEVPAGYQVDAIVGQPLEVRRQATVNNPVGNALATSPNPGTTRGEVTPSLVQLVGAPVPNSADSDWVSARRTLAATAPITAPPTPGLSMTVTTLSVVTTTAPTTETVGSRSVITAATPTMPADAPLPTASGTPTASLSADLELALADTPDPTAADGMLTYVLRVANHGPGDAHDVVVRDALPPQVRLVHATLPVMEEKSGAVWKLGTLAAGDRRTLQVVVAVHSWVTRSFTNTAVVTAATLDKNSHDNQAAVETAVTDTADLAISAEIPTLVGSGSVVTCTLVYTNFGPAAARNITIVEQLAAEISFGGVVSAELRRPPRPTTPGTLALEQLAPAAWIAPQLAAGTVGRIVFTATVQPGALGTLTSTVVITSVSPDSDWDNNDDDKITRAVPVANVAIAPSAAPSPVVAGGTLTYTLTYTNHGPWTAEGVLITLTLPASVTLPISATLPGWTSPGLAAPTRTGPSLTWSTPSLLPGASGTIALTVTVDRHATGPLHNQAIIRSSTLDGYPDDNMAAGSVNALTPALSLAQTAQPGLIAPRQPCTYTLHITNTGAVTFAAQSLSLVEMLPPGFRSITITATQFVTPPQTWAWRNPAPLAPGKSLSVSLVVSAMETVSPSLYRSAAGATATVPGGLLTATAPVSVRLTLPSVAVAQQVSGNGASIATSDRLTLTIRLTNTGPSPLTAVPLLERHDPRFLHLVGADPAPEEILGDGAIGWRNLAQAPPHGIGRDIFPGKVLTVTLTFDVARPLMFGSVESHVTVGELRDVYGNLSDGYAVGGPLYEMYRLYLPLVIRSS